jgi:hypothetical protein
MEQTLRSSSQDVLAQSVPGGHGLTTQERQQVDHSSRIKGWGSDLDPRVRPGVPRDKAPQLGVEHLYPPIQPQVPRIKIHKSTEHAKLPPVFGTSCPPSGLSGRIRDFAYEFSEGRLMRWMALIAADRVNVLEGIAADLAQGRVPNLPKEMGLRSELKYNAAGFARKVLVAAACTAALAAYMRMRGNRSRPGLSIK